MTYTAAVSSPAAIRFAQRLLAGLPRGWRTGLSTGLLAVLWASSQYGHAAPLITAAEIHTLPHSLTGSRRAGTRQLLQLSALGRDISIELEASPLLARWPEGLWPESASQLYRGIVNGEPRNWARISIDGGLIAGHLWMEDRLWRLQHRSRVPALPAAAGELPDSDWLLYDTMSLAALDGFADRIALPPQTDIRAGNGFRNNTASLSPQQVTRAVRLGIVIDSRFDAYHGLRGLAEALDIVNGVDGLYQAQLGVAVVVEAIRVFDDPDTDPLNQPDAAVEDLLQRFRTVRLAEPALAGDLSLVHLFSGNEDPTRVIGLGWIDTVCRPDGYDVSLSTPFAFSTLLTAHEIAHNLGALHDEDPACAMLTDSRRHIMGSRLSSSSIPEFSACSLRDMAPAVNAQCLADNIDVHIALRANQADTPRQRWVSVEAGNRDASRPAREIRTRTEFPVGTVLDKAPAGCSIDANQLLCRHGTIAAGTQSLVTVLATLPSLESQPVVATLESTALVDINDTDNRAGLDVMLQAQGAMSPQAISTSNDDVQDSAGSDTGAAAGDAGVPPLAAGTGAVSAPLAWCLLLLHAVYRMYRQRLERQSMGVTGQRRQGLHRLGRDRIGA